MTLVYAHPTPLILVVLGVPHNPRAGVAALRCSTGSSSRLPLGPGPAIRADAAKCTFSSRIGRGALPAILSQGVWRRELLSETVGLHCRRTVPAAEDEAVVGGHGQRLKGG